MNEGGSGGQPKPELGVFVNPNTSETAPEYTKEIPASQEFVGNKPIGPPSDAPVAAPPATDPATPQPPVADQAAPGSKPAIVNTSALYAQDQDRIEQQWINAVKIVSSKTRSDPFAQNIEMSKVKADYIHKRFNKTIKTNDTGAP